MKGAENSAQYRVHGSVYLYLFIYFNSFTEHWEKHWMLFATLVMGQT